MSANVSRDSLERALSPERFRPYLADAGEDFDLAWKIYQWNLRLVGALMPLISDVEVTLRNTIHRQISKASEMLQCIIGKSAMGFVGREHHQKTLGSHLPRSWNQASNFSDG